MFGCLSYIHINECDRSKLDPKSNKYFFNGYDDVEFDYRFWDNQNQKIIRSRNVIFNEQDLYKDCVGKTSDGDSKLEESSMVDLRDFLAK